MKPGPVIDDIRKSRSQISASVGHEPQKLVQYYQKLQSKYKSRLVKEKIEQSKGKDVTTA